jgi:D-sedoheptulose 7-phosphate isomerase
MDTPFTINSYFNAHQDIFEKFNIDEIDGAIQIIQKTFESNKKIITCGNGGSASTASHYITDWNKMVNLATGKKFRGISLCDNVGLITAYGNDLSYEDVFSGQLDAIMDEGDLLVAISGSGNSPNVIKAVTKAKSLGGQVLGVVGYDGGLLKPLCDYFVWVKSFDMQLCEDIHLMFGHMVMKTLCNSKIKS